VFDKKEAVRFVVDAIKHSGLKAGSNLLGFDACFKELDRSKNRVLEIGSMTSLVLKVLKFGK
jgi:hypothetical protein